MLTKRIIPCLDVKNGTVVKGVNFVNLQDMGDPIGLAKYYSENGADELVFLDITATTDNRSTMVELVGKIAENVFIPFTIGGGIRSIEDIRKLLHAGADKVSINSQAVSTPELIEKAAQEFGSQCIVVAIDALYHKGYWEVCVAGGKIRTGLNVLEWVKEVETLGAGEILLTSINKDGTQSGFDLKLYQKVTQIVNVPVIASGGVGNVFHFCEIFKSTSVDAALAATVFHSGEIRIPDLKNYLRSCGVEVRV